MPITRWNQALSPNNGGVIVRVFMDKEPIEGSFNRDVLGGNSGGWVRSNFSSDSLINIPQQDLDPRMN